MLSAAAAKELIGRRVIVGITNRTADGRLLGYEQHEARIVRANAQEGVVLQTHAGGQLKLPPDLRPFFGARRGHYTFKSTGHVAMDPELSTTWTRTMPPDRSG